MGFGPNSLHSRGPFRRLPGSAPLFGHNRETIGENFKAMIFGYGVKEEHGDHK